jgi:hypothetical protein
MNDKPVLPGVPSNVDLRRLLDRPPPAIPPGPSWAGEMTPEEMQGFGNVGHIGEADTGALSQMLATWPATLQGPRQPSNVIRFPVERRRTPLSSDK